MILTNTSAKNSAEEKPLGTFGKAHGWRVALVLTLVVAMVVQDAFFFNTNPAQGATFVVTQSDWQGGVGAKDTPWTTYESITGLSGTVSTGNVQIATTTAYVTSTDAGSTSTGFNLSGAVTSSAIATGSGDSASIVIHLASTATAMITGSGGGFYCALSTSGAVYCWGDNAEGSLGDGTLLQRNTPVRVLKGAAVAADNDGTYLSNIRQISGSCAVSYSNNIYCWGDNSFYGAVGDGTTTDRTTPVRVLRGAATTTSGDDDGTYLTNIRNVSSGRVTTCAVSNNNNSYCWGSGTQGELGTNGTISYIPVRTFKGDASAPDVDGTNTYLANVSSTFPSLGGTFAVTNAGNIYSFGSNASGMLGNSSTVMNITPVRVWQGQATTTSDNDGTYLTNIKSLSGGWNLGFALSNSGTVYGWGSNANSYLGDGTGYTRYIPRRVVKGQAVAPDIDTASSTYLANISSISDGSYRGDSHECAISYSNKLYCWGYGAGGALGDGAGLNLSASPIRVVMGAAANTADNDGTYLTNVLGVSTPKMNGPNSTCAVTYTGNAYCWGSQSKGELGNNTSSTAALAPSRVQGVGASGYLNLGTTGYPSYATYTSGIITATNTSWGIISYSTSSLTGTSITIKARSSANLDMAGATDWSSCTAIASGAALSAGSCVTDGQPYIQYQAVLATTNAGVTPSLNSVTIGYSPYSTSGNLVSSAFDTGDSSNVVGGLNWTEDETLPEGTTVTVSVRASSTSDGLSDAVWADLTNASSGCTKAGSTVTCTDASIPAEYKTGSYARWMQYKVTMTSAGDLTPTVGEVSMVYVVNSPPEIDNVTATQNADGTLTITYGARSTDTSTDTNSVGVVSSTFAYCDLNGLNCTDISSQIATSSRHGISVNESTYTTNTVTWIPIGDLLNQYRSNATIKVTVSDNQGANSTDSAISPTFIFDTTAPESNSIVVDASVIPAQLYVTSTDDSAVEMMISTSADFTGALWVAYSQTPTTTLSDPSTVYVKFRDAYGNVSSPISVTTPTAPSSVMVQDTSNVLSEPPEYRLFAAWKKLGAGSGYKVYRSLDNETWSLLTTINDYLTNFYGDSTVENGVTYYYRIAHRDSGGNTSFNSSIVSAIADGVQNAGEGGGGVAETVISNVASSTTPGTATVTWSTDLLSNSEVGYSTTPGDFSNVVRVATMVDTAEGNGPHSVSIAGLTPNTTYYFQVRSTTIANAVTTDNNGGNGFTFTTQNGPIISNAIVERVTNSTARIKWDTSSIANSYVYYSANSDLSVSSNTSSDANVTSHDITITGLTQGTKYYFYVQSTDPYAVTEYDKNVVDNVNQYYNFRTTADLTAPVISSVASSTGVTTANIAWTTDELSNSQVEYGLTDSYGSSTTLDPVATIRHVADLTELNASTTYHFRVKSRDDNNNLATGNDQTFTTTAAPDIVAPVISSVTTTGIGLTTATITWTTDEAADSIIDFGTTLSYGQLMGNTTESVPDHTVTLINLVGNTTYKYRVLSKDSSGNLATDDNGGQGYTFTTALDVTPPAISDVATVLVSDTSAVISWTTNEAAVSLVSYGESTSYGTVSATTTSYTTNHSVTLTGLTRELTYYYKVTSIDASGNSTTEDNSANGYYTFATTREPGRNITTGVQPRDTAAPLLSSITITDITDRGATVSWNTDEPANALIEYGTSTNYVYKDFNLTDILTSHSLPLKRLSPETTYHFKLYSYDAFGNRGSSDDQSFKTISTLEALTAAAIASSTEPLGPLPEEEAGASPEDVRKAFESAVEAGPVSLIESLLNAMVKNPLINTLSEKLFVSSFTDVANKVISAPNITGSASKVEVDGSTAKISWITDKKSSSEVGYAEDAEYGKDKMQPYTYLVSTPDEFDTKHMVTILDLKPNTVYHYQLRSKGIAGPVAKSRDELFKTEAELPVVTDFFTKDVTEHSATVVWKTNIPTSANVEFKAEDSDKTLSQGDADLIRDHSITLKDLKDGISYTAVVKATDASGAVTASEPVRFITLKDVVPPTFATMKSESTFYAGKESKVQTIISWETDEPATSQVFYKEGVSEKGAVISVPEDPTLVKKHTVVITKFKPGAVYKFWVISKDATGNEGRSKDFTVLTPQQKETVIDIIINNFEQVFGWTQKVKL